MKHNTCIDFQLSSDAFPNNCLQKCELKIAILINLEGVL